VKFIAVTYASQLGPRPPSGLAGPGNLYQPPPPPQLALKQNTINIYETPTFPRDT